MNSYTSGTTYYQGSYPSFQPQYPNYKFPYQNLNFAVSYSSGGFTLGRDMQAYSDGVNGVVPLVNNDLFVIRDEDKFVIDTGITQWKTVNASDPWFVQLIIQSHTASNTAFRLCWHTKLPTVIRLSCTVFDRQTAAYRGVYVVDDSDGLGAVIYGPVR